MKKYNHILLKILTNMVTEATNLMSVPSNTLQKILKLFEDTINHLSNPSPLATT